MNFNSKMLRRMSLKKIYKTSIYISPNTLPLGTEVGKRQDAIVSYDGAVYADSNGKSVTADKIEEIRKAVRLDLINNWVLTDEFSKAIRKKLELLAPDDHRARLWTRTFLEKLIRGISNQEDNGQPITLHPYSAAHQVLPEWATAPRSRTLGVESEPGQTDIALFKDILSFVVNTSGTQYAYGEYFGSENKIILYLKMFSRKNLLDDHRRLYEVIRHEYIHAIQSQFNGLRLGNFRSNVDRGAKPIPIEQERDLEDILSDEINSIIDRNVIDNFDAYKAVYFEKFPNEASIYKENKKYIKILKEVWEENRRIIWDMSHIHIALTELRLLIRRSNSINSYSDFCSLKGDALEQTGLDDLAVILKCNTGSERIFNEQIARATIDSNQEEYLS